MKRRFFAWLFYRVLGWKKNISIELPKKAILCVAPHTSNWDFIYGQYFALAEGWKVGFLMKESWFFWPLGVLFRKMGGVPVSRRKNQSLTETMANKMADAEEMLLCITPEGTRQRNGKWKRGFYYIATGANVPILLFGLDYDRKLVECSKMFVPTGNVEKDMQEIKQHFAQYTAKYPGQFTIDEA